MAHNGCLGVCCREQTPLLRASSLSSASRKSTILASNCRLIYASYRLASMNGHMHPVWSTGLCCTRSIPWREARSITPSWKLWVLPTPHEDMRSSSRFLQNSPACDQPLPSPLCTPVKPSQPLRPLKTHITKPRFFTEHKTSHFLSLSLLIPALSLR